MFSPPLSSPHDSWFFWHFFYGKRARYWNSYEKVSMSIYCVCLMSFHLIDTRDSVLTCDVVNWKNQCASMEADNGMISWFLILNALFFCSIETLHFVNILRNCCNLIACHLCVHFNFQRFFIIFCSDNMTCLHEMKYDDAFWVKKQNNTENISAQFVSNRQKEKKVEKHHQSDEHE